jgi:hypothetical protein
MKTPPLLLGTALMFWGWQTGFWIWAAAMALAFEASRLIRIRWNLADTDFRRISDVCTILLILLLIYVLMSERSATFIVVVIQWLPVVLFPLVAGQSYSTSDRVDIRTLFLLRRKKQKAKAGKPTVINFTYPYFAICLVSAGAANVRDGSYAIGIFVLVSLAFWTVRSPRFSVLIWICAITLGGCVGFMGQIGLHGLQLVLEQKGLEWTSDFTSHDPDPFKAHTAIGDIGTLKPSDRIIFRVTPEEKNSSPLLLRETSYNRYISPLWVAMDPAFKPLKPDSNETTWHVSRGTSQGRAIVVATPLYKGKAVLKLPDGAFQIARLPVSNMEKNRYGTVKVEGGPGIVAYRVYYDAGIADENPPIAHDLEIPEKERPALDQIHDQLQLGGVAPREILKRVKSFFWDEFEYSLDLAVGKPKKTALSQFLLENRAGHCEYFATATVLLLRTAGIPARYARGYSVHEYSNLENRFVVRASHAHAWALMYIDGSWRNLDTTPGSWVTIENSAVPQWQVLSDLWSWCRFNLTRAWWWLRQSWIFAYVWWLILPLGLIPARRLFRQWRIRRSDTRPRKQKVEVYAPAGADSEFYLIEEALKKSGFERRPAETLRNWIGRMSENQPVSRLINDLQSVLALHYRYRFDPEGLDANEKKALTSSTHAWLDEYRRLGQGG